MRMKQAVPKQFIKILEKPIVVHTIEAFFLYDPLINIILVLPQAHRSTWEEIHQQYLPHIQIAVALGGNTRFQSVKSGLQQVSDGYVAIHDAVRPLVSAKTIASSFESAQNYGSGVAMVPLKDSIRQISNDHTKADDRSKFLLVQTPQTFRVSEIQKAFELKESSSFTDDASVYEAAGMTVLVTEGEYSNIKITTPEDLLVAETLLKFSKK